jgi:hypothetical protein
MRFARLGGLIAGSVALCGYMLWPSPRPAHFDVQLHDVQRGNWKVLGEGIRDVARISIEFDAASTDQLSDALTFHGVLRLGEADYVQVPIDAHTINGRGDRVHGTLAIEFEDRPGADLSKATLVDVLRSQTPLAVQLRAWDGNSIVGESAWIDLAPMRHKLLSLMQ